MAKNRSWQPIQNVLPDGSKILTQRTASLALMAEMPEIQELICTGYIELVVRKNADKDTLPISLRIYDTKLQAMWRTHKWAAFDNWRGLVQAIADPCDNTIHLALRPFEENPKFGAKPGEGTLYFVAISTEDGDALRADKKVFELRSGAQDPLAFVLMPDGYMPELPSQRAAVTTAA